MWALNDTNLENDPKTNAISAMMGLSSIGETPNAAIPSSAGVPSPTSPRSRSVKRELPPLFWYMETGDWGKATERIRRHTNEVKTWATLKTKSAVAGSETKTATTKRLALHHACFKLRGAGALPATPKDDPFVEVCRFILLLIQLYPEAAEKRESRHGCLPLHLASFASCAPKDNLEDQVADAVHPILAKPIAVTKRSNSDTTTETNMSAVHAEETYTGSMSEKKKASTTNPSNPNVSVSMRKNKGYSIKREEMLVQVINALLDAYPKASRVDSEGGRLPLHTACAGRATPRVVSTLVTAYPAAARQRNKDGFLPLHLAAHWGVSHIAVAVTLLRTYPDATVGRNRWERTPLEEALCMAGENGRPHQAALVRGLRKHPSWWTRVDIDFMGSNRGKPSTIVDVDESLPSIESGTFQEQMKARNERMQQGYFDDDDESSYEGEVIGQPPNQNTGGIMSRMRPSQFLGKGKVADGSPAIIDPLGVGVSLAHVIERRMWNSVLARIDAEPLEAEQELHVMTKGGFMSGTGLSPLHYSCERKPPVQIIQKLIKAFPFAVLTRAMPGGCLPLHIACTWGSSAESVKALLAADAGSARVKDELGNVPLHSACFSGASLQVVEALLQADTKSVVSRNHQGSRPMDICKRLRHENREAVMEVLSRKKEDLMRKHGRSRSSGLLSEIAHEAEEMNKRHGTPQNQNGKRPSIGYRSGDQLGDAGVEVTYEAQQQQQDQLNWI